MSQKIGREVTVSKNGKAPVNVKNRDGVKIINDDLKLNQTKTDTNEIPIVSTATTSTKRILEPRRELILEPIPVYQGPILTPQKDTKDSLGQASTISFQDANKRVDDILLIAEKVSKATSPDQFEIVFQAAFKAYVMSTFRHQNNMSAKIDI